MYRRLLHHITPLVNAESVISPTTVILFMDRVMRKVCRDDDDALTSAYADDVALDQRV